MQNSNEFLNAADIVKKLTTDPTNIEKGQLYGLYKQATIGNINIEKPSNINIIAVQKWNEWNKCLDIDKRNAEIQYINLVNSLIQKYGIYE